MFGRARLRLALLYIALMGVTLAFVAGGILVLGAQQARRTEDLGLRLRAERESAFAGRGRRPPQLEGLPRVLPTDGGSRVPQSGGPGQLEQEGILIYEMPVQASQVGDPPFGGSSSYSGLPSRALAQAAVESGGGRFQTLALDEGQVRVYSLPVVRNGQTVAVVQAARSSYFVDATVRRLLLIVAGAGAVGLVASSGAAFWLAGRTLRPIAQALQRQRDFTADASHELRTPLALVRGNAELLQRHPDKRIGAYDDVVQDIVDEADRLTRLVSDLLTLARADSGQVQIAREPLDLSPLADELIRHVEPLARAKGLLVRGEIMPDVRVIGDRDRLRQLGLTLLDNAVRYTAAGAVTLRVGRDSHGALLAVSDSGPGIDAEHLPHLFDRFYRTDAARTAEAGGAGLGLAIAQWIAEAHGGRIAVASTPGRGSTFTVHLPRLTSAASSSRPTSPAGGDGSLDSRLSS